MASSYSVSPVKRTHPPPLPPTSVQVSTMSGGYTDAHPTDEEMFKRRYVAIQDIINELEDENNLIAYRIAKIRKQRREALEADIEATREASKIKMKKAEEKIEKEKEKEKKKSKPSKVMKKEEQEDEDQLELIDELEAQDEEHRIQRREDRKGNGVDEQDRTNREDLDILGQENSRRMEVDYSDDDDVVEEDNDGDHRTNAPERRKSPIQSSPIQRNEPNHITHASPNSHNIGSKYDDDDDLQNGDSSRLSDQGHSPTKSGNEEDMEMDDY
ncbi:uncharacterized protein L201_005149 [Kwoniella dendrophila CBS 6074]|uniref:Uncharacterized protein n=1 Tax=Kwoniella dendrophila CBS 6074 TaxID=1295534 RepID=A0AAX4JYC9_9TREE